jgi:hypothetical protein
LDVKCFDVINARRRFMGAYESPFEKNGVGHQAEAALLSLFAVMGAKVLQASPFQDDWLAVDFWMVLKVGDWKGIVPVQLTIAGDEVCARKRTSVRYRSDGERYHVALAQLKYNDVERVDPEKRGFSSNSAIKVLDDLVDQVTAFVEGVLKNPSIRMATLKAARIEESFCEAQGFSRRTA